MAANLAGSPSWQSGNNTKKEMIVTNQTMNKLLALLLSLLLAIGSPAGTLAEATASEPITQEDSVIENEDVLPPEETVQPEEVTLPDESGDMPEDDGVLPQESEQEELDGDTLPDEESSESLPDDDGFVWDEAHPLKSAVEIFGSIYVLTVVETPVYSAADMNDNIFTVFSDCVLLATGYDEEQGVVEVWFIVESGETLNGYVYEDALSQTVMTYEDAQTTSDELQSFSVPTDAGELPVFVVTGTKPDENATPSDEWKEPGAETPEGGFLTGTKTDEAEPPVDLATPEPETTEPIPTVSPETEAGQADSIEPPEDMNDPMPSSPTATPSEAMELPDTTPIPDRDTSALMEEETADASDAEIMPLTFPSSSTSFNLVNAYGEIKSADLYDFDVYADSDSRDVNKHPPIAKCDNIDGGYAYAYPHTFNYSSAWVYCIEHNYDAPSSRNDCTGPYVTVDWEGYTLRASGGQSHIYSAKTMRAIAWSVRHSWPFKKVTVSGESADDINFWSFCAGQIAIREIIGQMEGRQYIRDGWDLSDFYRFRDCAPSDYLNYARWLVSNAVSYAEQFGNNDVSTTVNSVARSGENYVASITVHSDNGHKAAVKKTDAVVELTGTSAGSEQAWYYVNDGETVNVTLNKMPATLQLGLVGDSDDECGWVIAVPNGVSLQRLFVPQEGSPRAMPAGEVKIDMPRGSITVTKKSISGTLLPGATFELLGSSGSVLQTQTTDASGVVTFSDLDPGSNYTIREKNAPKGYRVAVPDTQGAAVTAGAAASVTFTNDEKTAKIKIVKTDQISHAPLTGAQFTITRLSGPAGYTGGVQTVATLTTGPDGTAETGWLGYGKYRVEETAAPEYYVSSHFSQEIDAFEDGKTYTFSVENEPIMGFIQLTKTDRLDQTPIEGVQFDIFFSDENGGDLAGTMTTGADGTATSGPLRKGKYLVKEHADPEGYVAELVTQDAVVNPGETTVLHADNQPIQGRIRIVKKDQLTREVLAGAEFTITRISGVPSHKGVGDGETVAVVTTGTDGVAETPLLTYGKYRVTETKAPKHFVDQHFSTEVFIDDDMKTCEIEVENEPTKGYIQLTKTDRLDQTPIEGVQFDIFDSNGEQVGSMTTGADGVAMSEPLTKGEYTVKEHADPEGYVEELIAQDAVVKSDETTTLYADNQPIQGKIRIVKKDQLTKEALAGAEFTITRISGVPSHKGVGDGETVAVMTTGVDGVAETPLLTYGKYRVTETKVPEHFVDNAFSTEVFIKDDNMQTYEIEVENEPTKGWLRLTKRDRQNGNPIEGVQFDIYYNDQYGEGLAETMTTGADGVAISEPLRKGRYIVREHGATPGYLFEEIELETSVRSDETTELEATNRHVTVRLRLLKRDADEYGGDSGNASTRGDGVLSGAEFQVLAGEDILDRQGNVVFKKGTVVVESLKTEGDAASVTTDELWPGLYEIVELSPPTGYQPSDEHVLVDARDAAGQSAEAVVTYEGVKTNEIKMGAKAIIKILGDDSGELGAGKLETPEAGAEFNVYLRKAGSYENAREFERDHLITDENGYAMTKALPYGVYVLEQTAGKEGYEIKAPIDFMIDGRESLVNPPIMTLSDRPILYRLKLVKADTETGNTVALAGTSFRLKDSNGEVVTQTVFYPKETVIDTFTTDESGEVTLPETVNRGLYFIEEVKSPEGYLLPDEELAVFVGRDGDKPGETYALTITISNEPVKGRIILEKRGLLLAAYVETEDAYGNAIQRPTFKEGYLAGAVFELRAAEDIVGADGTIWYSKDELIETLTTVADGPVSSMELPLGCYKLIEIAAPDGYTFDDTAYEVELEYADNVTPIVETKLSVSNIYMPVELSLEKVKEVLSTEESGNIVNRTITTAPGEGFVFGLFLNEDIQYDGGTLFADTLCATAVTDKNGNLTFSGRFPHAEYYVKELYAPIGWKINPNRYAVSLTPEHQVGDIIAVELDEAVYDELVCHHITLTKTDITGENTLPGALIEVRDEDGNVIYRDYTDEDGEIKDIPVTPGRYTFREVWAPDGYALNDARLSFVVNEDGSITGDTTIRDDYTRFFLLKRGENGEPLAGVEFGLFKEDGTLLMTAVTDEDGLATFEKISYGDYTIIETKPLPGYLKSGTQVHLSVDGRFVNPSEPVATVTNEKLRMRGKKLDTSGNPLAGAEFALIDAQGYVIQSAMSDENGEFILECIPYGDWIVRETEAPDGFSRMEDRLLHVDESWTEPEQTYTFVDIPDHYEFVKVDGHNDPLPGVKFALEDAEGTMLRELVSDEDGIVHVTGLTPGTYTIRETEALEGYTPTDEVIELTIDERYVAPEKLKRIKNYSNYSDIQTGVDFPITPLTVAGAGMLASAALLAVAYRIETREKRRHSRRK